MLDRWTGEIVGTAFIYDIPLQEIAKEASMTYQMLSRYLHCHAKNPSAEPRIRSALMRCIERREPAYAESEVV